MKKLYYLLCLCVLTGCTKSSNPAPASSGPAIDYEFTSAVSDTYNIQYTDQNEQPQTVTINGTTWSKKFILTAPHGAGSLGFTVTDPNGSAGTATGSISINSTTKVLKTFVFSSSNYVFAVDTAYNN